MTTATVLTTSVVQTVRYGHLSSKSRMAQLPPNILVIHSLFHTGSLVDCLLTRLRSFQGLSHTIVE